MSSLFEPHEPHVILVEYDMYLRLPLHFIWIKIPDEYQITSFEFRLVLNQSVVPMDLELSLEERSVIPLFSI